MDDYKIYEKKFKEVAIESPFFDSFREDYPEFNKWFKRKGNESAYVLLSESDRTNIKGFCYLKDENEELIDIEPAQPKRHRLKIGTLKIIPHQTRLGERFLKIAFDTAINMNVDEIYVTVFEKHEKLIELFCEFGFQQIGVKANGTGELVLSKSLLTDDNDYRKNYPRINMSKGNKYLLGIYPEFHSKLFPDSILKNETSDIIQDISFTNSIYKYYLGAANGLGNLRLGDLLVIYRTKDENSPSAYFSAVATSICTVLKVKPINSFDSLDDLMRKCSKYSVFNRNEFDYYWKRRDKSFVIKLMYNAAFKKRIIRKSLVEDAGIDNDIYWGFSKLSDEQFTRIIELSETHSGYFYE